MDFIQESDLIADIVNQDPDVVIFGEYHVKGSPFRQMTSRMLRSLRGLGFQNLAIEFRPGAQFIIELYCHGKCGIDQLTGDLIAIAGREGSISEFDSQYFDAVKFWVRSGGRVVYVNSSDPILTDAKNHSGRDQFMKNEIHKHIAGKVVVWIGQGHSFVRTPASQAIAMGFGSRYLKTAEKLAAWNTATTPEERSALESDALSLTFLSAAEKLHLAGVKVYTIGEIQGMKLSASLENSKYKMLSGSDLAKFTDQTIMLSAGSDSTKNRIGEVAPELIWQVFPVSADSWNVVFLA